jgi:hypothetical protein
MCPNKDKETGMYALSFSVEEIIQKKGLRMMDGRLGNGQIGWMTTGLTSEMHRRHASRLTTTATI